MKKIYLLFIFITASTTVTIAQNKDTKKADKHFDRLEYIKAGEAYEKLIEKDKADTYVYQRAADSYYLINDTEKAEPFYEKAVASDNVDAETVFRYAQTLKTNGKTEKSNTYMNKFAQMKPQDQRAKAFKQNPNYIPQLLDRDPLYTVEIIEDLNSELSDFGGVTAGNKIYFASARNTSKKKYGMNEQPFLDIYQATIEGDSYTNIEEVPGDVNTKYHEASVTISPDGNRMYFDRNDFFEGNYEKSEEGINQLNIYYAELVDGRWRDIQSVPFNSSEYSVGHPALSPDGNTLYFVSDMPGSVGDSDIYKVSISADGSFGEPENLGANVNTEGKEVFPFVSDDGTLYFSSNGHLGLGGLDVFFTDENYNEVKNIGSPVNSRDDDFAFKYDTAEKAGYVSSDRNGNDDIFRVEEIEICESNINLIVINEYTDEPITGAKVDLYDTNENKIGNKNTPASGKVSFKLECDQELVLQAEKENFEPGSASVTSTEGNVEVTIELRPIEEIIVEDKIVLNPILFDFDKHNIKPQAATELDKVVQIMKKYPKMVVKVEGHTDIRGNAEYNKTLSDRRAKAAVEYIISKGVDEDRISGEGFGQERPVVDCAPNCSEEDHDKNRRSEFIIVER